MPSSVQRKLGFLVGACLHFFALRLRCARPESNLQARYLIVSGSHVETVTNVSDADFARLTHPQEDRATTSASPDVSKPHACEDHFAEPQNWRFSISFGQEMKRGISEEMEENLPERETDTQHSHKEHELERIRRVAIAFRGAAAVVERGNRGMYVRPAVDAWTQYFMKRKFGCTFKGEVRLSLSLDCEDTGTNDFKTHTYDEEDHESTAFRLSAPRRLRVAATSSAKDATYINQASEMRLIFCVKPGSGWNWMPLAMFWYFRDADGKSARTLWQDGTGKLQTSPAVKNWAPEAVDKVNLPMADEKEYLECNAKRWVRFEDTEKDLVQAFHDYTTLKHDDEKRDDVWNNVRQAEKDNLKAAKIALAGTPCKERDTQGLQEHSSIVIRFLQSRQQHQDTVVKVAQARATAAGKGPGFRHKVNA